MHPAKKLIGTEEERAVSPVIGVILMVAITVILAAVIAAFVMDIGPGGDAVTGGVDISGSETGTVTLDVTDGGNADQVVLADDTGAVVYSNAANTGASYDVSSGTQSVTVAAGSQTEYSVYLVQGSLTAGSDTLDGADGQTQVGSAIITN